MAPSLADGGSLAGSLPATRAGGFWSALDEDSEDDEEENGLVAEEDLSADGEGNDPPDADYPLDEEEKRLLRKRRKLKALLGASRKRADALVAEVDAHTEEVMNQEKERMQVLEVLSRKGGELRQLQEQRAEGIMQELEKLNAATQVCSESETRVQFLVERIVALLSSSSIEPAQIEELKGKRQAEREMLQQFEEIRQQYDEVRQQNCELTSRLMEESSLSRRLSDQLAEAEERFFRFGASGGDWQQQTPSATNDGPGSACRGRSCADAAGTEADALNPSAVPPLPFSRRRDPDLDGLPLAGSSPPRALAEGENGDATWPADPAAASAPRVAAAPRLVSPEASPGRGCWGATALGAVPEVEATTPPGSSSSSAEAQAADEADPGAVANDGNGEPVNQDMMESMLMEALDRAAFGYKVVRWHHGVYGFGGVRALVRLEHGRLMAAAQHDADRGLPFMPIAHFLQEVVAQAARSEKEHFVEEVDDEERWGEVDE